jgi:hypothetical protein
MEITQGNVDLRQGTLRGLKLKDIAGNTYATPGDRWIVSLVVGYHPSDGGDERLIDTPEKAALSALELTRDMGCSDTHWWVHDRETGADYLLEQETFDPDCGAPDLYPEELEEVNA